MDQLKTRNQGLPCHLFVQVKFHGFISQFPLLLFHVIFTAGVFFRARGVLVIVFLSFCVNFFFCFCFINTTGFGVMILEMPT